MHSPSPVITVIGFVTETGNPGLARRQIVRKFETGIRFLWNQICGVFTTLFTSFPPATTEAKFNMRHNTAGTEIYFPQLKYF